MPRGKKNSVGQDVVEFCDAELAKRGIGEPQPPAIVYPTNDMIKRYHMYRSFFPEQNIEEFCREWSKSELEAKLQRIKAVICNSSDATDCQANSSNVDMVVKKSLSLTFGIFESIMMRFVDCHGYSQDISESQQMLKLVKAMLVENEVISYMLSKLIKVSVYDNVNVHQQVALLIVFTFISTVNRNRAKKRASPEELRSELDSLKE